MHDELYARLANALGRLPNGFPRTGSNVEMAILKLIFTPEEAAMAGQMSADLESVNDIASRMGVPAEEAGARLANMCARGLVWSRPRERTPLFRLAPFMVGIYEAQLENMDHRLAHLVEEYFQDGGLAALMKLQPALHRVVPAQAAAKSEWILPYDDVKGFILAANTFGVADCICRKQQSHLGRKCDFPLRMCLRFSSAARFPGAQRISREEALAILDMAEEIGLVHMVSNVAKDVNYVCHCCGCCCTMLRGINELGVENSVACANYFAVIDADECAGCGTCAERCQVGAISCPDKVAVVDRQRCIGCGLCATGCPNQAARIVRKPENEMVHPPLDFGTWEEERQHNRGMR